MNYFKTYFPNFETLGVKIGDKTVDALIMANLGALNSRSKFMICINESEISFEQNEDEGLGIIPITPVNINEIDYSVISGRLINENQSIKPFYQLELQKL